MDVLRVNNATVRGHIENFTNQYCQPYIIKFQQDGSGAWVVPLEAVIDAKYNTNKAELKQYLHDNGINPPANVQTIKDALENWGTIITYTP